MSMNYRRGRLDPSAPSPFRGALEQDGRIVARDFPGLELLVPESYEALYLVPCGPLGLVGAGLALEYTTRAVALRAARKYTSFGPPNPTIDVPPRPSLRLVVDGVRHRDVLFGGRAAAGASFLGHVLDEDCFEFWHLDRQVGPPKPWRLNPGAAAIEAELEARFGPLEPI